MLSFFRADLTELSKRVSAFGTNYLLGAVISGLLLVFGQTLYLAELELFLTALFGDLRLPAFFVYYLVTAQSFSALSTLIFGNSLGHFLWGLRAGEGILWKRLGSCAREILAIVFIPMMVPLLFLLIDYRTPHEYLSMTRLKSKKDLSTFYIGALSYPCLLFLFLSLPQFSAQLVRYYDRDINWPNIWKNTIAVEFKDYSSFRKEVTGDLNLLKSKRFGFEFQLDRVNPSYELIPYFDIGRAGHRLQLVPFFLIYDYETGIIGEFRRLESINWQELYHRASWGNPFITRVEDTTNSISSMARRSLSGDGIISSFLIGGRLGLSVALKEKVTPGLDTLISYVDIGDKSFLQLGQSQGFENESYYHESYLGLVAGQAPYYRFSYPIDKVSLASFNRFKKRVLANAYWSFDDKSDETESSKDFYLGESFQSSHIVDYLVAQRSDFEQAEKIENYVYQYYFRLLRRSLRSETSELKDIAIKSLRRTLLVATLKERQEQDFFSETFFGLLREMVMAIEENNLSYFGIN